MVAFCPGRTLHGIVRQFYGKISIDNPGAKVITIEPAQNALAMEWAVKLFSAAFEQACALKKVQPITLQRIWEHASALVLKFV